MSRLDIASILKRLSLDHRTSLVEKASAYLQVVESNSSIRNHPSHAAICINIAADQLSIEISQPTLIRLSGAASSSSYNSSLQTLTRHLTSKSKQDTDSSNLDIAISNNSRHAKIQQMISNSSLTYLRQLAVQYGSMELVELVLECLDRFFEVWINSLPPAQRAHVKYADAKWIGAAFWLCAMARGMTVGKDEEQSKTKVKRIGGRGGKPLKDLILDTLEHKVKITELDKTIGLIEDSTRVYLLSLRKTTGGRAASTPSTTRKRKSSNNGDSSVGLAEMVIPMRGNVETNSSTASKYRNLGTKRQISNVSQMSVNSDSDGAEQDGSQQVPVSSPKSIKPVPKRAKLDLSLSSADIMNPTKAPARKSLKELAAPQESGRLLNQRRNTGGVYSMIPRVKYENTKAYEQYQVWKAQVLRKLAGLVVV
ncbi:hypothetical protein BGZ46_010821 [Entomortierella lignicola]|nr:hypothetical protein BGZ46_010821 [Entomortierella lignicola]